MNEKAKILKDHKRMCINTCCDDCTIWKLGDERAGTCWEWIEEHPEEAIDIIEKWAEEHPIKTRADVFLEHYPGSSPLGICPHHITPTLCIHNQDCITCKKNFWSQEVEE